MLTASSGGVDTDPPRLISCPWFGLTTFLRPERIILTTFSKPNIGPFDPINAILKIMESKQLNLDRSRKSVMCDY